MHKDLELGFNKMIEAMKTDPRCKGGWHYGSVARGLADEYSDYDPVFLVPDKHFEDFARDVPQFIGYACDEVLISWAEDYNSEYFKNFCNLIRINENLHQLDFFILNQDKTDNWWCRQHVKGCTPENIIYDKTGEVAVLLQEGLTTEDYSPHPQRCFDTYWFHLEMLIKYFKRGDIFKLLKNIDFLFHAHGDLLLSEYDTLDWGAWETKIKTCVPIEKQQHLLHYHTKPEFQLCADAMKQCMELFHGDAIEVFQNKGIEYPARVAKQVRDYFLREVNPR